eukprot:CAMPEP_0197870086 /NCGR_PEP_ID=MMETSP1439-20131203/862_1 /TAXON_ID=66791 /ORGANISM="Gonyaulax spinifera, Strain CCMP409" /LENGTH=48 /DNA_ID= /DNA_START= /DNA_END= /DNA_ORIENTATION=
MDVQILKASANSPKTILEVPGCVNTDGGDEAGCLQEPQRLEPQWLEPK